MIDPLVSHPASTLQTAQRGRIFFGVALVSTLLLAGLLIFQPTGFESTATPFALVILLTCTVVFLRWIPNPIPDAFGAIPTLRWRLIGIGILIAVPMFVAPMLLVGRILFAFPVIALAVLWLLRRPVSRREVLYALALALVAGVAGLWIHNIRAFSPLVWAILQVPLVFTSLLCGWKVLEHTGLCQPGLAQPGVGRSRWLVGGLAPALRGFGMGMLLSLPWALANILMGGSHDPWVKTWWQPLAALQPGIAEEAWGRIFLVPLLYLAFRRAVRPRVAFTAALILAGYWFAYLHSPMGVNGILTTVLLGTLYSLPISYLCLYRDLETAIGFHFMIDFLRFLAAFLLIGAA